jgi:hypothetical protein
VGDWTGQGKTTVGVFDPSGSWYLRNGNAPGAPDIGPFRYGAGTWYPVAGIWTLPHQTQADSLMTDRLVTGVRRTQALDQAFAASGCLRQAPAVGVPLQDDSPVFFLAGRCVVLPIRRSLRCPVTASVWMMTT